MALWKIGKRDGSARAIGPFSGDQIKGIRRGSDLFGHDVVTYLAFLSERYVQETESIGAMSPKSSNTSTTKIAGTETTELTHGA